ncbi:recombination protein RecT [Salmonella enterica subsp. enterica]|uniref:Recombination protein RecT n=1 Tax=Salmonella enterica TaxID=28901 RepID=A0A742YZN1_SALER|nr:recombination protein RecT [Salmonella enterica]EBG2928282.1 recombination protein RecT [Salmonella enterica subsp. enterica serovar Adelaide]EBQ9601723.1 recombination protein RecT [Salmonella enterica subsp. enterica serovar Carmel]EBV2356234.1 recombination protein RecT [Salmonella enterica subsp. enterica serovar Ago]ECD1100512.1 recombination protein RecT [Salmonella enterica subsp. enterica serovar Enteritidis]ECG2605908.1 recombination protein RecT [Salmonella enterica subsp. enteric
MPKQPPIAKADLQKTQGARTPTAVKNNNDVISFINQPSMKEQLAVALPRHMTAERMIRIATTEIRKVPALGDCDTMSFVSAIVQCSQLGLEPGGALGHAYLLPFGNKNENSGKKNVQLIIGYRGMIDLARRSGQIASLSARVVREGDDFSFEFGLEEKLVHRPGENEDAPVTHVYAVARLKDGGTQFEVMTRKQIELVRAQSKAGNNGPWVTHWEEMAKKTAIRRLFKYLPVSIEIQRAVSMDEKETLTIDPADASVITGEYSVVENAGMEENVTA